jgi:hypothetical protein
MPGQRRPACSQSRRERTSVPQNGQVRHWAGRSSYTPHTARPGRLVRSRNTQSSPAGEGVSRSERPSRVLWVYSSMNSAEAMPRRGASAATSASLTSTYPSGPVQQLPHIVQRNRSPRSPVGGSNQSPDSRDS